MNLILYFRSQTNFGGIHLLLCAESIVTLDSACLTLALNDFAAAAVDAEIQFSTHRKESTLLILQFKNTRFKSYIGNLCLLWNHMNLHYFLFDSGLGIRSF